MIRCSPPSTTTRSTRSPSRCATSGTSDRNFYDRYYFNIHGTGEVHGTDEELFAVIGVGQYPNLSVADAFVSVQVG